MARILYIEDDSDCRALVRRILEHAGHEIVEAAEGLTGIESALRERPALILLDINLPGMDGYAVAAALNSFPKLASTPIVAVTAYASAEERERILVAGCDGYIAKPIDVDAFPRQVADFLRGKREKVSPAAEVAHLRDLNQRFVCRLLTKLDEVNRLSDQALDRARRLEEIHEAVQDLTSEIGLAPLIERLLPRVARALNAAELSVELSQPPGLRLSLSAGAGRPAGALPAEIEWKYPLVVRSRPLGFLIARYVPGAGPTADDEQLFKIIANQMAIAIENCRLYETERAAHAAADVDRGRHAFLARAGVVLGRSLDYGSTVMAIAQLAVPDLADLCLVDVVEDDGTVRRSVVSAGDPAREELAATLRRFPPDPRSFDPVIEALRTQRPALAGRVPDSLLPAVARDAEHLAVLRALAPRSVMIVPMVARGRALGAITLCVTASEREYTPADLAVAEELAARAALALDNARLYRELHDADRNKDMFLATLAHELRTPLAPILNAMAIVRRYEGGEPVVRRAREVVERQVRHQARILDDLLDLARTGHGKIQLHRTEVDVRSALDEALELVRPLVDERGQAVVVTAPAEPLVLTADATRLVQILANLLVNASKFTPAGGQIFVALEREREHAVVRVRDTGSGIEPTLLPRIFDPFFQAGAGPGRGAGVGIGLALVRRLAELHGGSVEARSPGAGQGSEFVVRLPAAARAAPAPSAVPAAPVPLHILVIEDDADTLDTLRLALELDGHRVDAAAGGRLGIELAVAHRPQAVLVDIGLPGIDGYEVARRLRQSLGASVFLVAISGYSDEDRHQRAAEAGFDAHLLKPVDVDELRRVLASAGHRAP